LATRLSEWVFVTLQASELYDNRKLLLFQIYISVRRYPIVSISLL